MKPLSVVFALSLIGSTTAAFGLTQRDFAKQLEQYNYFSNSPATFATFCQADDCQSAAVGHRSFERNTEVTTDNLISIGSNSKFMTAVLAMILVEKGEISLDDQLTDYYPEYALWQGVTVRHLLQQATGIPCYLFSKDGLRRTILSAFNWQTRIWKPSEVVALVEKQPLQFKPGSRVEYNNTNYVLLGMIIERATRTPLAVLMEREIFAPLAMRDTYVSVIESEKQRRVAGYVPLQVPMPDWLFNLLAQKIEKTGDYIETTRLVDDSLTWAAGGMVSTTADIAKLLRGLFTGKLISQDRLQEMMDFRQGTVMGYPLIYGLGLMRLPSEHGDLIGHGGLTPGYQIFSNYIAEKDLTLNLAQNLGPGPTYSVYFDLLDVLSTNVGVKTFATRDAVHPARLANEAIHIRTYGKLIPEGTPSIFFSRAFGYARVQSKNPGSSYQAFETFRAEHDGRSVLIVRGLVGSNPFAGAEGQSKSSGFIELVIDREAVLASNDSLFVDQGQNPNLIFAYRGTVTTLADGKKSICISDVIDRSRELAFQIDGQEGEAYDMGQTIKFVGNIPFKRLSMRDVPPELQEKEFTLCK